MPNFPSSSDIAPVAHDLRANLDEFLLEARQRPIFDRLGRRQRAQEVAEIVGERRKLEPDGVGGERAAREPFQRAEVAIPRNLFADILRIIGELRPPPVTSTG